MCASRKLPAGNTSLIVLPFVSCAPKYKDEVEMLRSTVKDAMAGSSVPSHFPRILLENTKVPAGAPPTPPLPLTIPLYPIPQAHKCSVSCLSCPLHLRLATACLVRMCQHKTSLHRLNTLRNGRSPAEAAKYAWLPQCLSRGCLLSFENKFYLVSGSCPGLVYASCPNSQHSPNVKEYMSLHLRINRKCCKSTDM